MKQTKGKTQKSGRWLKRKKQELLCFQLLYWKLCTMLYTLINMQIKVKVDTKIEFDIDIDIGTRNREQKEAK